MIGEGRCGGPFVVLRGGAPHIERMSAPSATPSAGKVGCARVSELVGR